MSATCPKLVERSSLKFLGRSMASLPETPPVKRRRPSTAVNLTVGWALSVLILEALSDHFWTISVAMGDRRFWAEPGVSTRLGLVRFNVRQPGKNASASIIKVNRPKPRNCTQPALVPE